MPPLAQKLANKVGIADVALNEFRSLEIVDARGVTGIGQRVQDHHALVVMLTPVAHEIAADEAGAAGHENISHWS